MHRPIFIISWVRSGSTLLRYIVDTHPHIACPAEVEIGPLCAALGQALVPTLGVQAPGDQGRQLVTDQIRRIVSSIMSAYATSKRKALWCDKSPTNALFLPHIESVFPDARYVCLYRDGVDVVHSSTEFRRNERIDALDVFVAKAGNQLEGAIDGWLEATAHMQDLEKRRPSDCYRVHYETLVNDPAATIERLFAWLEVEPAPDLLERVFTSPHDPGDGDVKAMFSTNVDARSIGRGRARGVQGIASDRKQRFDARLVELGYAKADEGGAPIARAQAEPVDLLVYMKTTLGERLKERFNELRHAGAFKLVIEGLEPGTWLLDFTGPRPYLAPVDHPTAPAITMSAVTFAAIVSGDENPAAAYLDGRIRIDGDKSLVKALRFLV